jgi:hypothetical protein
MRTASSSWVSALACSPCPSPQLSSLPSLAESRAPPDPACLLLALCRSARVRSQSSPLDDSSLSVQPPRRCRSRGLHVPLVRRDASSPAAAPDSPVRRTPPSDELSESDSPPVPVSLEDESRGKNFALALRLPRSIVAGRTLAACSPCAALAILSAAGRQRTALSVTGGDAAVRATSWLGVNHTLARSTLFQGSGCCRELGRPHSVCSKAGTCCCRG